MKSYFRKVCTLISSVIGCSLISQKSVVMSMTAADHVIQGQNIEISGLPPIILPLELANKSLDDLIENFTFSKVTLKSIDCHVQNVGTSLNLYRNIVNKLFCAEYVSQFIHESLKNILKELGVVLQYDSHWPYNNIKSASCDLDNSVKLLDKLLDSLIYQLQLATQNLNIFDHYRQVVENKFDKKQLIKELSNDDITAKIICDKLTDIIKKYNLEK